MLTQIGRFLVQSEVGRGGFGRVYRALDPAVGRLVAVKVLTEGSKDLLTRFRNEASVAANLRHDNIVTIYEYGEHEGNPFLAMEYLEGEDLHQIIAANKPLSLLEKCKIMLQVAEGLDYAHGKGVIHRDVKPANIMVLPGGHVKIMDFGIARLTQDREATRLTQEGSMIGTLLYMAPEQLSGSDATVLSDIFAYGVTFYELLAGRHPFQAADPRAMMYKLACEEPPPLRDFIADCPEALQRIIGQLLHKDPELRFPNLRHVQFQIEPLRIELQQENAATLLLQAQAALANQQWQEAQSLVSEVLSGDPSNRAARSVWEDVQRRLQLRALQPRIEALLKAGEEDLTQRRFSEAVAGFESALRLDKNNISIQGRLEHARGLRSHFNKARELLVQARNEFEQQDLTAAFKSVSEAFRHDPQNPEGPRILEMIERAMDQRRRAKLVEEAINKAEALLIVGAYDDAIAALARLGDATEFSSVQHLRDLIKKEQAQHERLKRLKTEIARATDLLRKQLFEDAVSRLEALKGEFPESEELSRLHLYASGELEAQVRTKAVNKAAGEANALSEAKDFDAALSLLDQALKNYPGEGLLMRALGSVMAAKAEYDRERAIEAAVSECQKLRSQKHFGEAIQLAEAAAGEHGADPRLVELLQEIDKEWEQQRRIEAVRKAVDDATNLLDRNQPNRALEVIQRASVTYPNEGELLELLARAQEELRAIERAKAVEATSREAAAYAEAEDFDRALDVLARGLKTWPEQDALIRQQKAVAEAKRARERHRTIAEAAHAVRQLAFEKQFDQAVAIVTNAIAAFPDDPELIELLSRVQREQAEQERREAVQRAASEARLLLSSDRLEEAVRLLEDVTQRYSGELELESLAAKVKDLLRRRERAAAIQNLVLEVRQFAEAHEFDQAIQVIEQGLRSHGADPILVREFESLQAARADWRRKQAISEILGRATQLRSESRFDDALQLIGVSLKQYVGEPSLVEAQQQLENGRKEYQRREEVTQFAAEATSLLDQGQLEQATETLHAAWEKYPDEPQIQGLRNRVSEQNRLREHAEAVSKAQFEVRALAERHEFDAALSYLEAALQTWPADEELLALRGSVRDQRQAWEYGLALRQGESLAQMEHFQEALQSLDSALERYPGDRALSELRSRIETKWEHLQRAEEVAGTSMRVSELIEREQLEEALELAREATRKFPGEATLESLVERAEQELITRKDREQATRKSEALMRQGRFEEAIHSLQETASRFPRDSIIADLLSRARRELETRRRTEALQGLRDDTRSLAAGRKFAPALALLERGLQSWPGEQILLDLKDEILTAQATWQRKQALQDDVRAIEGLRRNGRFAEALTRLQEALQRDPGQTALLELRTELRKAQRLREVRRLIEQGNHSDALELMEPLCAEYPSDPEVTSLAGALRRATEAREQAEAIRKLCAEASASAATGDFEAALSAIDDALKTWPKEDTIVETRRAIIRSKESQLRRQAVSDAVLQGENLEKQDRLEEAFELISRFADEIGDEPAILETQKRLMEKLREREQRRKRQSDIEELLRLDLSAAEASGPEEAARILEYGRGILGRHLNDEAVCSAGQAAVQHLSDIGIASEELAKGNPALALEICDRYLKRFPNHVAFAELRIEAESALRVAYLDRLQHSVTGERNLDNVERLLREGLDRYPNEPWIQDQLKATRNKLDLIGTIAENAKAHEAAGEWEEALADWRSILPIYSQYPEITAILARVERQVVETRTAAVDRLVRRITGHLETGDLDQASRVLQAALAEFPDEPNFQDVSSRLEAAEKRREQASDLLLAGEAAFESGNYEEGLARLQEGAELDSGRSLREFTKDLLLHYARPLVQSDWRMAERMVAVSAGLDPAVHMPEDLAFAIAQARTDEAVKTCVAAAQGLRERGQLTAALAGVDRVLTLSPDEVRLTQLQEALTDEILAARERLIQDLLLIEEHANTARDPKDLEEQQARLQAVREKGGDDSELNAPIERVNRALVVRKRRVVLLRLASYRKPASALAAGITVLGVAIWGVLHVGRRPALLEVVSSPPGAIFSTEGQVCQNPTCQFRLSPGNHSISAELEGFRPAVQSINLQSAKTAPIKFVLEPLKASMEIRTNYASGSVVLDGVKKGALENGAFQVQDLPFAKHELLVSGSDGEAGFSFETAPGRLPSLQGPMRAKDTVALLVSNIGHRGKLECNCELTSVSVDGKPVGGAGTSSLELRDLGYGAKTLRIGEREVSVNVGQVPSISLFLMSTRNVGTIEVQTNVDNVTVLINKQGYVIQRRRGVFPLNAADYVLEVQKSGYITPARRTLQLKKGDNQLVTFQLVPKTARLEVLGARPETGVFIDHKNVGTVRQNGVFSTEVNPGYHDIELSLQGFISTSIRTEFDPGGRQLISSPKSFLQPDDNVAQTKRLSDEQQTWDATDKNSQDALRQFLQRFQAGNHAESARSKIADLVRAAEIRQQDVNKTAEDAKKAEDARKAEDIKRAEDVKRAEDLKRAEDARKKAEQLAKERADREEVLKILTNYEAAYNRGDLKALMASFRNMDPRLQKTYRDAFRGRPHVSLKPGEPRIEGETATVTCSRTVSGSDYNGQTLGSQTDTAKFTLRRVDGHWVIDGL